MTLHTLAVLWDLDGTLADTEHAHYHAWRSLCQKYGRDLTWDEFKPTFGMGNPDILRLLLGSHLDDADLEPLSQEKEALFRAVAGEISPMPGAGALVAHLARLAVPQAIGSSAPPDNIVFILDALGLTHCFAATVSRWQVAQGKPFPDIFLRAAVELGVPADRCVVLEDAPAGLQAAEAAGMHCIALSGTWSESALSQANLVVSDLKELCWSLEQWDAFASTAQIP